MTGARPQAPERTVVVSPEVLERICPDRGSAGPRSRLLRLWVAARLRARLLKTRLRFRLGDLQPLRCRVVQWRLRAKLAWMRLRHRGRL